MRYIDDSLILHTCTVATLRAYLDTIYPPHLQFTFEFLAVAECFYFLDLWVESLVPLTTCVYFKVTNTASYIPWSSDQPRRTKVGWVRGEGIRALRLCTHEKYFDLCVRRIQLACIRLGYPQKVIDPFPVGWLEKPAYRVPVPRDREQVVHVFKQTFHSSIPVRWGGLVRSLNDKMSLYIRNLRLHVIFQTPPPLGKMWSRKRHRTLTRMAAKEDQQVVDDLVSLQNS